MLIGTDEPVPEWVKHTLEVRMGINEVCRITPQPEGRKPLASSLSKERSMSWDPRENQGKSLLTCVPPARISPRSTRKP